ncbi:MAG: exosortase family protein XrtF [Patiriisocius sp.]
MKALLVKYKNVIRFVTLFIGTYIGLSFLYSSYLKHSATNGNNPDPITQLVAKQCSLVLESIGYDAQLFPHGEKPQINLIVEGRFIAYIIEGCNAVSIFILFLAFVIAFANKFRQTLLFAMAGIALIYAVNILRIVMLTIALYRYPEYSSFLHGVVFPALIYGMVFILWMVWVRILKKQTNA